MTQGEAYSGHREDMQNVISSLNGLNFSFNEFRSACVNFGNNTTSASIIVPTENGSIGQDCPRPAVPKPTAKKAPKYNMCREDMSFLCFNGALQHWSSTSKTLLMSQKKIRFLVFSNIRAKLESLLTESIKLIFRLRLIGVYIFLYRLQLPFLISLSSLLRLNLVE
ncbi:hypothetical protein PHYBLDRAFT_162402 [Phycomyces blakesleeanus NRRL 1555(-)]|uniref:Uncharacterized protein n=1 Tax=Phycomyces blakesleeanus (strain ATCC 8743b / DSM 1359 / FGSC 10004 / NBRC 33097 / NRRL 1555) TaxID=763407 RepID=A0A167Q9N4_PHYB8|nr:hypothetical protein PHYBLDRAFT_162402 [Phycomyces blakesleeanus NRRL 1555(-)]OAD79327.1 hypothetical protein PHYBLDRAFT_162402 [Phycomyces blakesleeanus NRRL 1555(-)]|eukprot:XP_018297367.1 hypothetical protein PHYBLDRAFT_162402 [Phycomyces blakesleeanus NRRL 1555(-)]